MNTIPLKIHLDNLEVSKYHAAKLKDMVMENKGPLRAEIKILTVESRKQRNFLHGAVYPLWAYLNDLDYRDSDVIDMLHEEAKREFNGEMVVIDGKSRKVGKSSKGLLSHGFLERVIDYLEEQYGIDRGECLDPERYKLWSDEVYPTGGPEDYIEYLKALKIIK